MVVRMRVLVIGGTGFIGRFVVAHLRRAGHGLAVFHRGTTAFPDGVLSLCGDRHDLAAHRDALLALAPDVVIDLALSSGAQARALVEVFAGQVRRVVVVSSMDVYRAAAVLHRLEPGPLEPLPLTERSSLRSVSQVYPREQIARLRQVFGWLDQGYDKVAVERAVTSALPSTTVLRLPMVYGPGDPLHRFHPWIKRMRDGRAAIPFDESAARWRGSRGYVENVAAAIALAAVTEQAAGRVYNVGDPDALPELEWARVVAEAVGWNGRLVALPAARTPAHLAMPGNLDQHWVADTTRIREELGYVEPVPRAEGVARTVAWERVNPPASTTAAQGEYDAEDAALAAERQQ